MNYLTITQELSAAGKYLRRIDGLRQFVLFLSLLLSLCVTAQVEPPTNGYLKGFQPQQSACAGVDFNSVVPLKINGVYRVYANVKEENDFYPEEIWLEDAEGEAYELTFENASNSFVSEEIPPGKSVVLKYVDGCYGVVEGKTSLTDYTLGQIVTVSNRLFSLVARLSTQEKRDYNSILAAIIENKTVDKLEKLSFIQQYLLKGSSLSSTKLEELNQHPGFQKMQDDCNCTVVTTYFTNTPGTHLQLVDGQPDTRTITADHTVRQSNELEMNLRSSGPAKLWHLYSDGWKRARDTWAGGATGAQVGTGRDGFPVVDPIVDTYLNDGLSLPSQFVQNTSIRMVLFCNNGVQTEECGCAKQIQPTAMYESEIGVRTQVLEGGGGTKRALAFGEDAAILYRQVITGPNAGEFQLMGADVFQMSSACNSDVNPNFFSNILSVVGDAAQIALSFSGLTPDSTADIRSQTEQLLSSIDTLSTTPRRFYSGDCAFASEARRFEFTVKPFFLRPSEVTQFALASRSRGLSMGMRSWQSEVLIKSDYRLAIFQPRGVDAIRTEDEEERTQCCTERANVSWIYGLIDAHNDVPTENMGMDSEPISNHFDMRANLGDALFLLIAESRLFPYERGRRVVPFQWGQLTGSIRAKEGCQVVISDEGPPVVIDPNIDFGGGKSLGNRSHENPKTSAVDCQYSIYTIDGKKMGEVAGTLMFNQNGEKTLNTSLINTWLRKRSLASGVYLVSSVDRRGVILLPTKKIVITK